MNFQVIVFLVIAILSIPRISYCQEEKVTIKADRIFGDQINNKLIAVGNVEINKMNQTILSDKIIYNKNTGWINSQSNIELIDLDVGNTFSDNALIKDDFSEGNFVNSLVIFNDGSYLQSEKSTRKSINETSFSNPILSVCPNPDIAKNDKLAGQETDLVTFHSSTTTIQSDKQRVVNKHAIIKILDVPIFYTPYISFPTKQNKRSSGFLTPSYVKNSWLGYGIRTPYFINAAPNTNIIVTPQYYIESKQTSINTNVEQLLKYGNHNTSLEISNNQISKIENLNISANNRTESEYRYKATSQGNFIFNKQSSVNFNMLTVGDKDYLRDLNFQFLPYTQSIINYEYTKNRDFFKISTIRFQELEKTEERDQAQWALPSITHHIQSKPQYLNEIYSLTSNVTAINRENGLQYNRITTTPKVQIPFNAHGNLFDVELSNQIDYYILQYNYDDAETATANSTNRLDKTQSNSKPSISLGWKLPLIKKTKQNTIIIEPQINAISSSTKKNFSILPNEDSNNSELSIRNLFSTDRLSGYDRNENGERINYGANSTIYTQKSKFEFDIGQSYLINEEVQDVTVNGFNNSSKSNIVGKTAYSYDSIFNISYNFQLDESNFNNKVNYASTSLNLKKFTMSDDYLLIRRGVISDQKIAQNTIRLGYKITPKLLVSGSVTRNLVTNLDLMRRVSIRNEGCCITTEFSISETNTSNLTKKQRSFNFNIIIKGL